MNHEKLEKEIMRFLLLGDNSRGLRILKAQYEVSEISSMEKSPCGVFFNYEPLGDADPGAFSKDVQFGDIYISSPQLECGGGALVFIEKGVLKCLEVYSYGDIWPDEIGEIRISYVSEERDFSVLDKAL